jgi:uncharacterized protein (DUF1499 family)
MSKGLSLETDQYSLSGLDDGGVMIDCPHKGYITMSGEEALVFATAILNYLDKKGSAMNYLNTIPLSQGGMEVLKAMASTYLERCPGDPTMLRFKACSIGPKKEAK